MEESDLLAFRRQKLRQLLERKVDPFGGRFDVTGKIGEVLQAFAEGTRVRVAGRITAHRNMGKSQFLDLSDVSGRLQIYINLKQLPGEQAGIFQLVDIGDFLGVEGECFVTKTGEPTIRVEKFRILSKTLRPLPDKWHGITDIEIRNRQRYLDLIANPASREIFLTRSRVVREIRQYLEERGFLEVETPMMQPIAGGAAAQPFKTHHNALDMDLFLRIAPELYLKRLLVAGFTKVFELNRNFRNEGLSRRHNPEFTMLEVYWAYADFELMANLVEDMICTLAERVTGSLQIIHKDSQGGTKRTINLSPPWRRARYEELIRRVDNSWYERDHEQKLTRCKELGVEVHPGMLEFEVTQQVFEKLVEERTIDPLFVTHLPAELVPLAKQNGENPTLVDVYELIISGQEISPGYSELNDPVVQRCRLTEQVGEEIQNLDEDFLLALEHGMPPAGGLGVGIDRLMMVLTGADSIREVILFPHLKPKAQE
ncbi:MAG: lysine--tRNA ligase [Verrucomicrobia bacterium]|nr:lysine--tRNA ligase [Verrucomicrobiota bacterium]MBV9643989.1 lysine--tRNA ligase [Verrucomicrobiota bacterium]